MIPEIKDIKVPLDLPQTWMWVWIFLGCLLIALLVWGAFILFKRSAKKPEEVLSTVTISAWEKAYSRLESLWGKKLIEQVDLKPFYGELSDIVRHYLQERFSINAPEMTTEEFLESLKVSAVLNDVQKQTLKDFLLTCDMVKFAKHESSAFEAKKSFDLAKQLIDQTCLPADKAHGI